VDNLPPRVSAGQSESGRYFCCSHKTILTSIVTHEATMQSWDIRYIGNADDLLYDHLASYLKDEDNYARYTSIIQSSGMGKSRAIDKLSKKHLVVPLNLCEDSKGKFLNDCISPGVDRGTRLSTPR
jgi:hypothetical protein